LSEARARTPSLPVVAILLEDFRDRLVMQRFAADPGDQI